LVADSKDKNTTATTVSINNDRSGNSINRIDGNSSSDIHDHHKQIQSSSSIAALASATTMNTITNNAITTSSSSVVVMAEGEEDLSKSYLQKIKNEHKQAIDTLKSFLGR